MAKKSGAKGLQGMMLNGKQFLSKMPLSKRPSTTMQPSIRSNADHTPK